MGKVADSLTETLSRHLDPSVLEIVDDSARHAGHAGATKAGESHFDITVESAVFTGLRPLARQRLIHSLLAEQLKGPVHALSMHLRAPGEN